jgi:adenosine deaminase
MNFDRDNIRQLPKGDVHNHLTLGVSRKTLKKHYQNNSIKFLENYDGLEGMTEFVHKKINAVMCTGNDVIKFMELAIEDSIEDNIIYLEASVDINLIRLFSNDIFKIIDSVSELKIKYSDRIEFRPEIGINKNVDVEIVYKNAIECIESGEYFGLDLYGPEKDMRLAGFVNLFRIARNKGLKTKVHIGEFSNYQTINDAIDILNPDEIQHGINAAFSKKTMKKIIEKGIRLNICPQSNVALGSVKSINEHPIRTLFDHGVKLTINTDDLLLFDATVSDQYISLMEDEVFSFEEIDEIRNNSLTK